MQQFVELLNGEIIPTTRIWSIRQPSSQRERDDNPHLLYVYDQSGSRLGAMVEKDAELLHKVIVPAEPGWSRLSLNGLDDDPLGPWVEEDRVIAWKIDWFTVVPICAENADDDYALRHISSPEILVQETAKYANEKAWIAARTKEEEARRAERAAKGEW